MATEWHQVDGVEALRCTTVMVAWYRCGVYFGSVLPLNTSSSVLLLRLTMVDDCEVLVNGDWWMVDGEWWMVHGDDGGW